MKIKMIIPALFGIMLLIGLVNAETFNSIEPTDLAAGDTVTATSGNMYIEDAEWIWITTHVVNTNSANVTMLTQGYYDGTWATMDSVLFTDSTTVFDRMIRNNDTNRVGATDRVRTVLTVGSNGDSTAQIQYFQNIEIRE